MQPIISWLAGWLVIPGAIFLLAVPTIVMQLISDTQNHILFGEHWGGWSMLPHLAFFVTGYFIALDSRFILSIDKHRIVALVIAIILFVTLYNCTLTPAGQQFLDSPIGSIARVLHAWFWLIAMMGFAHRHLTSSNKFLKYANEAVLPFYILHQMIILIIGYYIVQLDMSVIFKYLLVTALSFVASFVLYEPLIRRFNVLRFLFGMKLKRPRA